MDTSKPFFGIFFFKLKLRKRICPFLVRKANDMKLLAERCMSWSGEETLAERMKTTQRETRDSGKAVERFPERPHSLEPV